MNVRLARTLGRSLAEAGALAWRDAHPTECPAGEIAYARDMARLALPAKNTPKGRAWLATAHMRLAGAIAYLIA